MSQAASIKVTHFGVSPWEINALRGILEKRFKWSEEIIETDYEKRFVSFLKIPFPISYNEEFFQWFEYKRWDSLKFLLKEMKRRRSNNKAIKIDISFQGEPTIRFIADVDDDQGFKTSVEKIDFILELIPYHLDPNKVPDNITEAMYDFDVESMRWRLKTIFSENKKYLFFNNNWNLST